MKSSRQTANNIFNLWGLEKVVNRIFGGDIYYSKYSSKFLIRHP